MAYVQIPKDLSNIKSKFLFNLTKRQCICFSIAAIVGFPVYFVLDDYLGRSISILVMIACMFPFFILAMYEKHNQHLEVILKNYIHFQFSTPKQRPYMTNNFYADIERQIKLEQEVRDIVRQSKNKTYKRRKK